MSYRRKEALKRQEIENGYIAAFSAKAPSIFYIRGGVYDDRGEHIELSNQIGGGVYRPPIYW